MRRRRPTLWLSLATFLAFHAAAAVAAPTVRVTRSGETARLLVSGKLVAIFRTANGDTAPARRAELAAERLRRAIERGLAPQEIEARDRGETWGVYAGETLLMIATEEEARERNEAPEATARRWAANLRTALGGRARPPQRRAAAREPDLSLGVRSLPLAVGETRTLPLRGSARGAALAVSSDPELAAARILAGPDGRPMLEVRGIAPGRAEVSVEREGVTAALIVWVKKYAGALPRSLSAAVTGNPTPASLVRRVALEEALAAVRTEPGAAARIDGPPVGARALQRGESTVVTLPIAVTGEGYLPVRAAVPVHVTNVVLPPRDADVLLYSNNPESFARPGALYAGYVDPSGPARLFYHHQNRTGRPCLFQVLLLNPGERATELQVIEGDAGPFVDPVQVGHRATQRYMAAMTRDIGWIGRVPARGALRLVTVSVPNEAVVSGIFGLRITSGGPLVAHVAAVEQPGVPEITPELVELARQQRDVYPSPQKEELHRYVVGDPWTFIPIGRTPIRGRDPRSRLSGNYGVLYQITVDVTNPTGEVRTVRVVLSPDSGWARGVFVIEGELVEAPHVAPPAEAVLWTFRLQPGEQRRLRILGMPSGGGFYPVSLVVRS